MSTLDLVVYGTTTLLFIAYVLLGIGLSRGDIDGKAKEI